MTLLIRVSSCLVALILASCAAPARPEVVPTPASTQITAPQASPLQVGSILPDRTASDDRFIRALGGIGRLAFATNIEGSYQIGMLNLVNGELSWLTSPIEAGDVEPRWSPDGHSILFVSGRDPASGFVIYEMRADGSNQRPLIIVPGKVTINLGTTFSPDSSRIAFHTNRDGNMEIYVADRNGGNLRNLTNHPANDITPVWSADGGRIFFASDRQGNEYQIFSISPEGGEPSLVFAERGRMNYNLSLSPDGERLVFLSRPSFVGAPQIGIYNLRTQEFKIITNGFDFHNYPSWMGNDAIVFAHRTRETLPWTIRALDLRTGQSQVLLQTQTNASVVDPHWTPTR